MQHKGKILLILLALALSGCVATKKAVEQPLVVGRKPPGVIPPFRVGERLTYDAYYGLIHAGTATLLVKDLVEVCGRLTYHIVLTARTSPTFSKVFDVDDRVETWIDADEFIPWKFVKVQDEGDYKHDEVTILDQEHHLGHYRSNLRGRTKDYEIPEQCQDTLSIFYFLRLLSFGVGDGFSLKVMADEEIWDVAVEVKERVKRSIYRGESYDTFLLIPDVNFDVGALRGGKGRIWVTADERKLIVCIKTKLSFGYLTFALVKVDSIHENELAEGEAVSARVN